MEDMTIAGLETAKRDIKEPVHQPKSNKKDKEEKSEKPKEKYARKSPEELRKMTRTERDRYHEYCRDRDREKVKGVFKFYERPGGDMEFVYRGWKGDPVEKYHMIDGQTYEVPVGVARHLNNNGWYPEYTYTDGGKMVMMPGGRLSNVRMTKKVHRFGFQKLDFLEDDTDLGDSPSALVGIEYVDKGHYNTY